MPSSPRAYDDALDIAHARTLEWLASQPDRPVPARASVADVASALGTELPAGPEAPAQVVDRLARACEPGLVAIGSGRFYGFVMGGTLPAALAADWLVSAWDQNAGLHQVTTAASAVEDTAGAWLLDLLGLPAASSVGFTTGATMANFTALAAARDETLRRAGWDVAQRGLAGGPRVRVLVGAERHDTIDLALRYLGLGEPVALPTDDQGRVLADAMVAALDAEPGVPTIVCLQAGNVHSGAFDPMVPVIDAARRQGAWVHVDGAFGLWAAASPTYRHLLAGHDGADSWTTDAHKTLNVPYDCGIAVVREPATVRAAMGSHGAYLIPDDSGDPHERVPELSRRGRGIPVWAALRSLGRSGVADLVDGLCRHARAFADGIAAIDGAEVRNDVVFTQVCSTFGDDARTEDVGRRLLADGTAWMTGSRWRGRSVLRVSVSSWSTDDSDVARSLAALSEAATAARGAERGVPVS